MADSKITALAALTAADPVNDMFPIVDVSDTSMAASGTTKRISANNILSSSPTASGALTVTGLVTAGSATITGDLTVDTSTLKVDSTNNRVGVATATPGVRVDIVSENNTSLAPVLRVNSNNVAVSTSLAYDGLIGSSTLTIQSGTSSPIVFNTNGANESGRINTTGVYVLKGGTTTANGVGVAFPATQVDSSNANCLDDYEEGDWTPVLSTDDVSFTSVGYAIQTGKYTKVGRLVTVTGTIYTNSVVKGLANGSVTITGLPFTQPATDARGDVNCFSALLWAVDAPLAGEVNGSRIFLLKRATSVSGAVNLAVADVGTGATNNFLRFSGQYYV